MFRPNRIGPYGHFDGDDVQTNFAVANFDAVDTADTGASIYPWVDSATIPEGRKLVSYLSDVVTLAAAMHFSFGTGISGVFLDNGVLFSMDSVVYIESDVDILIMPFIGQSDASPLTVVHNTIENVMANFRWLVPTVQMSQGTLHMCGIRQSVNWIQADDGLPADEFPIIHGFSIMNSTAGVATFQNIRAAICVQRYIADHQIFDPSRG